MSTNAKNNQESLQEFGEAYYNSQSEGREEIAKETFGQYYHSPEAQGSWFSIKEKAIRDYQGDELTED